MKSIFVKDVIAVTKGELICGSLEDELLEFSKDTRTIEKDDIFLGIKGPNFNGSEFYKLAFEKGAKGVIVQGVDFSNENIEEYKGKFIIQVEDVVKALQQIAEYKRSLYDIPVIGITGSVGKTSTKDIIAGVMGQKYNVLKVEGNFNNHIGLPLTILKLRDHDAMVLEMGMSNFGEISLLTNLAKPTTAVITIIGSSHIGNLGSRENILKAKLEILEGLNNDGKLIFNNDNDLLNAWGKSNNDSHAQISYGIENESKFNAKNIEILEDSSNFEVEINGSVYKVNVPVAGKHFVYNSLAGIAIGLEYGIEPEKIIKGIEEFSLTKQRMEILKNDKGAIIINDCYNASYESVKAALEYMKEQNISRKIAVLGDVLELGEFSDEMHLKMGEEVVKNGINVLITVGEAAKNISKYVLENSSNIEINSYDKNEDAIEYLLKNMKENDCILVKASNGMHFKEIVEKIK